jgi:hypothetical protein
MEALADIKTCLPVFDSHGHILPAPAQDDLRITYYLIKEALGI